MRSRDQPVRSYTIWFSQRTGSTWFAGLLEATGVAGTPREHLCFPNADAALAHYGLNDSTSLAAKVRSAGTGANGVFGIKHGFSQPAFDSLVAALVPTGGKQLEGRDRLVAWEQAFPEHRHIFMTRRNKVRLAVSWWRAIKSGEWHRLHGAPPADTDLSDAYEFAAIDHLFSEAAMREAGIAELFTSAGVIPLALDYEDVVLAPEAALRSALSHLELPARPLPASVLSPIADEVSEEWVQRYRREKQREWTNRGW